MNRLHVFAAAGLLLGLAVTGMAVTPAAAQQGTINPEQACRDDAFRLCNDFIPDRDKVGACLRKKSRSLSKDCRTVVMGGTGGAHHRATTHKHYHHHN
ncbi:MAG TPA: hypothetical protein VGH49_05950 [Xanthobacteraceae bacterium]